MKDTSKTIGFIHRNKSFISEATGLEVNMDELVKKHLHKTFQHAYRWKKAGVPFNHGALIYLYLQDPVFHERSLRHTDGVFLPEAMVPKLADGALMDTLRSIDASESAVKPSRP